MGGGGWGGGYLQDESSSPLNFGGVACKLFGCAILDSFAGALIDIDFSVRHEKDELFEI